LPYTSYTDLSNNIAALPAPIAIPFNVTNNLNYVNYTVAESRVAIYDCYFGTNAGTTISTTANQVVAVTNSSGQLFHVEFFDVDLDTAGQTLPSYAAKVIGVLYGGAGETPPAFNVAVTRFADIVINAPTPTPLNALLSGQNLVLSWTNPTFSLQFSTNVVGPYTTILGATSPYTNTVTAPATGFYRLSF
jgi:hypothetical protein